LRFGFRVDEGLWQYQFGAAGYVQIRSSKLSEQLKGFAG
jgi:hypothetical protein